MLAGPGDSDSVTAGLSRSESRAERPNRRARSTACVRAHGMRACTLLQCVRTDNDSNSRVDGQLRSHSICLIESMPRGAGGPAGASDHARITHGFTLRSGPSAWKSRLKVPFE
jgi:hypothetical protein